MSPDTTEGPERLRTAKRPKESAAGLAAQADFLAIRRSIPTQLKETMKASSPAPERRTVAGLLQLDGRALLLELLFDALGLILTDIFFDIARCRIHQLLGFFQSQ